MRIARARSAEQSVTAKKVTGSQREAIRTFIICEEKNTAAAVKKRRSIIDIQKQGKAGQEPKPSNKKKQQLRSAKRHARVTEYGVIASVVLSDFDGEIDDTIWEQIIQDATKRISCRLLNDRYTLYGTSEEAGAAYRSRYYRDKINADNFDDFIDNVYANRELLFDYILDKKGSVLDYIRSKLMKFDEHLKYVSDGFGGTARVVFNDLVLSKISEAGTEDRFRARMSHYFTRKRIATLLSDNNNYRNIAAELKRKRNKNRDIERHILANIPDNYIDLYPEARQMARHFILHIGPTNSGKTHDALEALRKAPSGVYLAPLRLLACEVKDRLNDAGTPCDLRTGEECETHEEARHMSSTIEMLDTTRCYDVAVIDEGQMINDTQRGGSWTAAILGVCAGRVHICMAEFARDIVISLIEECSDTYEIVYHNRQTLLKFDRSRFSFPKNVEDGDALIVFSKRDVLNCAAVLQREGINCSVVYGALPYNARKSEVARFLSGETKVIVATDAIGMGMNLPIRRVVFLRTKKYDGTDTRNLYPEEVQQIAGRAGRYGLYDQGLYTAEFDREMIRSLCHETVPQIVSAPIGFPKSLIYIEGRLSDVMERWSKIRDNDDLFYKGDISEMLTLCKWMEQRTNDKELIYSFCTMPFDIKNEKLLELWQSMVLATIKGRVIKYEFPRYELNNLESMEAAFRRCDLYYCYAERVQSTDREDISVDRSHIAADIAEFLRTHDLPVRRCRRCGREIAWNYPYSVCERCRRMR